MRWKGRRQSSNIEDRRRAGRSMGGGRIPIGGKSGGLSLGGIVIIIILALIFKVDPSTLLGGMESGAPTTQSDRPFTASEQEVKEFVSVVLAHTEQTWQSIFAASGQNYPEPTLVLFSDAVRSACGTQQSAVGPFYCPGDSKVYLDTSFFEELSRRFGAPGDFAQAYVIAHEVGHHIQNITGISAEVDRAGRGHSQAEVNALSVRQELQADCFAGVWGYHAGTSRNMLEQGDVEEALRAASVIGDDALQEQARGYSRPESFTHGTSAQRVKWFKRGLATGDMNQCDTFAVAKP